MFGSKKNTTPRPLNDSGRSQVSESFALEGTLRTSGAIDISGIIKGPDYGNDIIVNLEFNSNFSKDSLKTISISDSNSWKKISEVTLPLQGKWLMSGRVRGKTERRRDTNQPRKTMKILVDGYFQWIAFNTNTFSFMGTGGGSYTAENGIYKENIDYFSRDNKKVGISLSFSYLINGQDWHHKGFSSKGDPLHEIWAFRNP